MARRVSSKSQQYKKLRSAAIEYALEYTAADVVVAVIAVILYYLNLVSLLAAFWGVIIVVILSELIILYDVIIKRMRYRL